MPSIIVWGSSSVVAMFANECFRLELVRFIDAADSLISSYISMKKKGMPLRHILVK